MELEHSEMISIGKVLVMVMAGAASITAANIGAIWRFWLKLRVHLERLDERVHNFADSNADAHLELGKKLEKSEEQHEVHHRRANGLHGRVARLEGKGEPRLVNNGRGSS